MLSRDGGNVKNEGATSSEQEVQRALERVRETLRTAPRQASSEPEVQRTLQRVRETLHTAPQQASSEQQVQSALHRVRETLRTAPLQASAVQTDSGVPATFVPLAKLGPTGPDLVICLDSGCGNYDQLWLTNSLRGIIVGELRVGVLKGSVHSGDAGGIVPTPLDIVRQLLDRVWDSETGRVLVPECHVEIPEASVEFAKRCSSILGADIVARFPYVDGFVPRPVHSDLGLAECLLNKTWRPAMSCIGLDGIPGLGQSSTTIQGELRLNLGIRLPPTADPTTACAAIQRVLEKDPPYHAAVKFTERKSASGWVAPPLPTYLLEAVDHASRAAFGDGKSVCFWGEGGSIPFMMMLGRKFPKAAFLVTGVLGPDSNAHGGDEALDIEMAKNVTTCVSLALTAVATHGKCA